MRWTMPHKMQDVTYGDWLGQSAGEQQAASPRLSISCSSPSNISPVLCQIMWSHRGLVLPKRNELPYFVPQNQSRMLMRVCLPQSPIASGRNLASTSTASSWGKILFTYASFWVTIRSTGMRSSMVPMSGSPESTRRDCWEGRAVGPWQHHLGWTGVDSGGSSAPRWRGHEEASGQSFKDFLLQINSKDVQMDTSSLFKN